MVIHGLQALRKEKGANASPPNLHYLFKRPGSHYVNRLSVSPAIEFSNFGKGREFTDQLPCFYLHIARNDARW